tara:strand:- start:9325 stop:10236 length:912 start_codon:yes stop_codon:yes gene_type:complete
MVIKLDGKKLAKNIEERLKEDISIGLRKGIRAPGLAVIRVGDDSASEVYVRNKEKACLRVGISSFVFHFSKSISIEELIQKISLLNNDKNVDGILLQLPLPSEFDETIALKEIIPDKDVDGLHPLNLGRLLKGEKGPRSCTPAGIMALLASNQIPIEGKRALVIGRSILVGQPMALMLQAAHATVTIAHSRTRNLMQLTREADLIVVAAGKPKLIGADHLRNNPVVVDVGIHRVPSSNELSMKKGNYSLCGDVRYEEVASKVTAITPVPGGVGPMTVTMLLVNTVNRWQEHCGLSSTVDDLLP